MHHPLDLPLAGELFHEMQLSLPSSFKSSHAYDKFEFRQVVYKISLNVKHQPIDGTKSLYQDYIIFCQIRHVMSFWQKTKLGN